MKKLFQLILLALLSLQAYAQDAPDWYVDWTYNQERPDWQAPDASKYENFTVMFIKIEEALQPYATSDDLLAIFVGDEIRGVAKPAAVVGSGSSDATSFVLKAFSNETVGDAMHTTLKYYNAQLKHIFTCKYDDVYDEDETIGVNEDFIPQFTNGSQKYPVVTTVDANSLISSAGITPDDGDMVGAFVGDECLGVVSLPLQEDELLNVYQSTEGETVTLKYYDASTNSIFILGEIRDGIVVLKGDVNEDGKVNVGDIMAVINIMSAGTNNAQADVNGDGKVNVGDIMSVINIMARK